MQKKLIALAIAGLASSAAFAQSNVTVYGRLDYGFMQRGGNDGLVQDVSSKHEFGSGLQAGSRIGFKGAEDLGNGLKAIFETEFGIGVDETAKNLTVSGAGAGVTASQGTSATWYNRHSYVGLTGGFGTVVGGRLDGVRYGIYNTYDPFQGGTVGNFTQMTRQVDRADNAIAYITPNFNGFSGLLAYSTNIAGTEGAASANTGAPAGTAGKPVGNNGDLVLNTIMGKYENGPISVTADYEQIKSKGADGKISVAVLAASYDFGVVKISGLYDWDKDNIGVNDQKSRAWMIGARAPIGKFALKANYGRVEDKVNDSANATKWALGVDYALSKRTNLYADFGKISNQDNAAYSISPAANTHSGTFSGNAGSLVSGYGVRGFDLGLAHNF